MKELKYYERRDIVDVLQNLELIIHAFDKIGSAFEGDYLKMSLAFNLFIKEERVMRKLLNARKILGEPFSRELDDDDMGELEKEMNRLKYWKVPYDSSDNELMGMLKVAINKIVNRTGDKLNDSGSETENK